MPYIHNQLITTNKSTLVLGAGKVEIEHRVVNSWFVMFILFALLLGARPAIALDKTDDIDTNRPSFMDSPLVVPKGSLQLENGTLYQHFQHGLNYYDIPETEVRLGLTKSTELQVYAPNYFIFHQQSSPLSPGSSDNRAGVSDIQEAGFKHQLPSIIKDLNISIIGAVTVPTGRRLYSSGGVQPVFRAPWGYALNKNWSIMGMQSFLVINSGENPVWENFWMLNRTIGSRTSVFAEYGGFYTHGSVPSSPTVNLAHFGAVRKLNKNNQIDIQFGFGMNKAAPAAFVGVGYSVRFDRLPGISQL